MSDRILLYAGAGAPEAARPITFDNQGAIFAADGTSHKAGWGVYVPESLREISPLTLRYVFLDNGSGTGIVKFVVDYVAASEELGLVHFDEVDMFVTISGSANTLVFVDVDISGKINSDSDQLLISLLRNSADPEDTYGDDCAFFGARTLDV